MQEFPISGHVNIQPGGWYWKQYPAKAAKEGPFDVVAGVIRYRLGYGGGEPEKFAEGRKLSASDFPGVHLPAGDFWCAGLSVREVNFDLVLADVRWLGVVAGKALDPEEEKLSVQSAVGSGTSFSLLESEVNEEGEPFEFPQTSGEAEIYLVSTFLRGAPETNPATGEKQRGRIYLDKQNRRYAGIVVGSGAAFAPTVFACRAVAPDLDGSAINLVTANSTGEKMIRVSNWWPRVAVDSTGWRRASLAMSTLRRFGSMRAVSFQLIFEQTPAFTL